MLIRHIIDGQMRERMRCMLPAARAAAREQRRKRRQGARGCDRDPVRLARLRQDP